ncbi:MAG: hypothetical protein HC904_03810 [Blastochloris sp.]|nr:hypothetical protein [Blastochloris sp.]
MLVPLLGIYLVLLSSSRFNAPFDWSGWIEPAVYEPRARSSLPGLRGMDLSVKTVESLETMVDLIKKNSSPNDSIFVFPHFPMIYTLSERSPATFSQVQWPDVCPDYLAIQDANTLRQSPPKIIVEMVIREKVLRDQEISFRGSALSGQRDIIQTISSLTQNYQLLGEFKKAPFYSPVRIWLRQDKNNLAH